MYRRIPSTRLSLLSPPPPHPPSPPKMSLPLPALLHPLGTPRKQRLKHRTAILALFSLVTFTCYLLFVANPSLDIQSSIRTHAPDHAHVHAYNDQKHDAANHPLKQHTTPHRKVQQQYLQPVAPSRPQLSLSPTEELAALSAFIAALPHNVLPLTADPHQPLDPQLILDFDPRGERAKAELDKVVETIWTRFPVMLFTKLHSSDSREIRHILSNMHLKPAPLVIEVDQRQDADVLIPLLSRLTHVPSLPILLIGGQPVGTDAHDAKSLMAEIRSLNESGELARRILEAGAKMDTGKKKGKGK